MTGVNTKQPILHNPTETKTFFHKAIHYPEVPQPYLQSPTTRKLPLGNETLPSHNESILKDLIWGVSRCKDSDKNYFDIHLEPLSLSVNGENYLLDREEIPSIVANLIHHHALDLDEFLEGCLSSDIPGLIQLASKISEYTQREGTSPVL